MLPAIFTFQYKVSQSLYLAALSLILFFSNRFFFRLRKILPMSIEVKNDGILLTDFSDKSKELFFPYLKITGLKGGVFEGRSKGLMKIETNEQTVGFFHQISGASILITSLLHRIPTEVYTAVAPKISSRLK